MADPATHHLGKLRSYLGDDRSAVLLPFLTAAFTASLTTTFAFMLEAAWIPAGVGAAVAVASGAWLAHRHMHRLTAEVELGTLYYVCVLAGDQRDPDEATFNHLRRWFIDSQQFTARLALADPDVSDESSALDLIVEQFRYARRYDTPATAQSLITNCLWHFGVTLAYRLAVNDLIAQDVLWHSQPRTNDRGNERPARRKRHRLHQVFDRLDLRDHVVDLAQIGIVGHHGQSTVDGIKARYPQVDPTDSSRTGFEIDDVVGGDHQSVLVLVAFTDQVAGTVSRPEFEMLRRDVQAEAVHVFRRLSPGPGSSQPIPDDQQAPLAIDAADYLLAILDAYPHSRVTLVAGITRAQQTLLGARLRARCDGQHILSRVDFAHFDRNPDHYRRVRYATPTAAHKPDGDTADGPQRVVNLTANTVVVRSPDGNESAFAPHGTMARRQEATTRLGDLDIDGHVVPLVHQELGELVGLPDPEPGVVYVVSRLAALACPERNDVVYPAGEIHDDRGQLVAVKSLGIIQPHTPPPGNSATDSDPLR